MFVKIDVLKGGRSVLSGFGYLAESGVPLAGNRGLFAELQCLFPLLGYLGSEFWECGGFYGDSGIGDRFLKNR